MENPEQTLLSMLDNVSRSCRLYPGGERDRAYDLLRQARLAGADPTVVVGLRRYIVKVLG